MIARTDLVKTARARLRAAVVLERGQSYDEAVYLCGYAVEIAFKARICRTLKWPDFPFTAGEFQNYRSLQTHNLETLLHFSGVEARIKPALATEWSVVTLWNPEQRYSPVGAKTATEALDMIAATRSVLRVLL